MIGLPYGRLLLLGSFLPFSLAAQIPAEWSQCRVDRLANWNCASYYSGTVTFTSSLRVGDQAPRTLRIVATISDGNVMCAVEESDVGRFEGPGLVAVAPAGPTSGGEYEILVWCPDAADVPVTPDGYPAIEIRDQRAAAYARLQGTDSWEHPDTDEVNDVSGTETVNWDLRRG